MKSDENVIAANAVAAVIWRAFGAIINQAMHGYLSDIEYWNQPELSG